MAYPKK